MLIRDLIQMLEAEYQRQCLDTPLLGEPEVVMDVWNFETRSYLGFTHSIGFDTTGDGVNRILIGKPYEDFEREGQGPEASPVGEGCPDRIQPGVKE